MIKDPRNPNPLSSDSVILDERLQELEKRQAVLYSTAQILHESPNLDQALPRLIGLMATTFEAATAQSWMLDAASDRLVVNHAWPKGRPIAPTSPTLPMGEGLPGATWRTRRPEVTYDGSGTITAFALPILGDSGTIGVVCLHFQDARLIDPSLESFLETIVHLMAMFVEARRPVANPRLAGDIGPATDSLWISERQLQGVFDEASIGMAIVGTDGRWIGVNRSLCRILGYEKHELLATSFQAITHPEDLGASLSFLAQLNSGEIGRFTTEKRYFHKNGRVVWVLLNVSKIVAADGRAVCFVNQLIDLTERKQVEDELSRSRRLFEGMAEASPDILYVYDVQTDHSIYSNGAMARILGYSPKEVVAMGQDVTQRLSHPDDLHLRHQRDRRYADMIDGEISEVEFRVLHRDGSYRRLLHREIIFQRGKDGKVEQVLGVAQDVTELRRSADQAKQQTGVLASILDQMADGVIAADHDGKILIFNAAARRILGHRGDHQPLELLPEGLAVFQADGVTSVVEKDQPIWRAIRGESLNQVELFLLASGRPEGFWISCNARPLLTADGLLRGGIVVFQDVTERKRAQVLADRERYVLSESIASAPIAIAMLDDQMRYLAYSARWPIELGVTTGSLLGLTQDELDHPLPDHWKDAARRCLTGETISVEEDAFEHDDGHVDHYRWAIHPWKTVEGRIGGLIMVLDRINDLVVARETALEASRLKSQVPGQHEPRDPHPDERRHRHDRPAPGDQAGRRAARLHHDHSRQRPGVDEPDQ